ncbi:hypothetical protein EJ110_NYTH18450 [Nymphaea thermarum]|nr:hypothetical protein EJ110_NYTH18450 [Nymphaea thermarum]
MGIEIKRVLEGLDGFEVDNVHTLNMEGKKKKRGGVVFAKPDYEKAYVTLKQPLSLPSNLFAIGLIEEEKAMSNKQSKSSIVNEQVKKTHWLDTDRGDGSKPKEDGADVIPEQITLESACD